MIPLPSSHTGLSKPEAQAVNKGRDFQDEKPCSSGAQQTPENHERWCKVRDKVEENVH